MGQTVESFGHPLEARYFMGPCLRASPKKYGSFQFRMLPIRWSKVNQYTTYSEVVSTMTLLSGCKLRVLKMPVISPGEIRQSWAVVRQLR